MTAENPALTKLAGFVRQHGARTGVELLVNFVLPFLIYDFGRASLGDVKALMASSAPPMAWSIIEFIRKRQIDALSVLVLSGIALGLLAFIGGGSAKFLQLRENLVTGLIALVFLGSAAIGKPIIYELARASMKRTSPDQVADFEALRTNARFRRAMTVMTVVWGLGMLAICATACALVFMVSIRTYMLISSPIGYGMVGLLVAWTFWYRGVQMRARDKWQAAQALAGEGDAPAQG